MLGAVSRRILLGWLGVAAVTPVRALLPTTANKATALLLHTEDDGSYTEIGVSHYGDSIDDLFDLLFEFPIEVKTLDRIKVLESSGRLKMCYAVPFIIDGVVVKAKPWRPSKELLLENGVTVEQIEASTVVEPGKNYSVRRVKEKPAP